MYFWRLFFSPGLNSQRKNKQNKNQQQQNILQLQFRCLPTRGSLRQRGSARVALRPATCSPGLKWVKRQGPKRSTRAAPSPNGCYSPGDSLPGSLGASRLWGNFRDFNSTPSCKQQLLPLLQNCQNTQHSARVQPPQNSNWATHAAWKSFGCFISLLKSQLPTRRNVSVTLNNAARCQSEDWLLTSRVAATEEEREADYSSSAVLFFFFFFLALVSLSCNSEHTESCSLGSQSGGGRVAGGG